MPAERSWSFAWLLIAGSFLILLGLLLAVSIGGQLHLLHERRPPSTLGMTLSQNDRQGGILVTSLQQKGPAELGGIQVGDRIISVETRPAVSASMVGEAVRSSPAAIIHLRILHEGRQHEVELNRQGSGNES